MLSDNQFGSGTCSVLGRPVGSARRRGRGVWLVGQPSRLPRVLGPAPSSLGCLALRLGGKAVQARLNPAQQIDQDLLLGRVQVGDHLPVELVNQWPILLKEFATLVRDTDEDRP